MRRGCCAAALALLAGLIASEARADLPGPFWMPRPQRPMRHFPATPKPQVARIAIEGSDQVGETRLQIPRKLLGTLQGNSQTWGSWSLPNVPVWPVAITLGLVLGTCALRLARGRRRFAFVGVGLLLVSVALCDSVRVSANAPPPIGLLSRSMKVSGQVIVEIVEEGDSVKLILDKKHTWSKR